jgi:redox-sensitive bicupin YhaK (pirin superfamily)
MTDRHFAAPQRIDAVRTALGEGMEIHRALPTKQRRTIGAWCFLDHIGPASLAGTRGLRVGPHPHIGLQTVTWLTQGEILHRDSLGSVQMIRPGQLNLMTSGRGISHSEESPLPVMADMHGVQFWIALPDEARHIEPAFDHHPELPRIVHDDAQLTVLIGEWSGARSPARVHTPLLGLDLALPVNGTATLPLRPDFEHGILVTEDEVRVDGETLTPNTLLYLAPGRDSVRLETTAGARMVVVGGEPFPFPLQMWWNFVARNKEELTQACREWNTGAAHFGEVHGYDGERLLAPIPPWATEA